MALLTAMLVGLAGKLGLAHAKAAGFLPQSTYIHAAMQALKDGDLDSAVHNYKLAVRRRKSNRQAEAAAELIAAAIDHRRSKAMARLEALKPYLNRPVWSKRFWQFIFDGDARCQMLEKEAEAKGYQKGLAVLKRLRDRLDS